jgi:signal peptidase I
MNDSGHGSIWDADPDAGSQESGSAPSGPVDSGSAPSGSVPSGSAPSEPAVSEQAPDTSQAAADASAAPTTAPTATDSTTPAAAQNTAPTATDDTTRTAAQGTEQIPQQSTRQGPTQGTQRRRRNRRKRSFLREFPILVAVALILAVVIKTYALQAFFIPSGSMEDTLNINDRVLINKVVYDFRGIHRGDIVVFNGDGSWDPGTVPVSQNVVAEFVANFQGMFGFGHPGDIYVKRVIGLPGDHVACCNAQGRVTVNGVALNESSYLYPGEAPSMVRFNIVVPPDRLWVMGDHRLVSDDSRGHMGVPGGGTIPTSAVLGRAFVIIWPPSRWRFLPIPGTFEQSALSKAVALAAPAADLGTPAATLASPAVVVAKVAAAAAGPALPLTLGFAGALPLTWARRRLRLHRRRRHP